MAQPTSRFRTNENRLERRTPLVLFITGLLCLSYFIDRHTSLDISSLQTGLYLQAPEIFDAEATNLNGEEYEWPYVWDAGSSLDASGYDWLGSTYEATPRGLDMPPGHDVFGEMQSISPQNQNIEYDEVVPAGSLPGGSFQERAPAVMLRMVPRPVSYRSQALLQQASAGQSSNGQPVMSALLSISLLRYPTSFHRRALPMPWQLKWRQPAITLISPRYDTTTSGAGRRSPTATRTSPRAAAR